MFPNPATISLEFARRVNGVAVDSLFQHMKPNLYQPLLLLKMLGSSLFTIRLDLAFPEILLAGKYDRQHSMYSNVGI